MILKSPKRLLANIILICLMLASSLCIADSTIDDGIYTARVTTISGTYRAPVRVRGGMVTHVLWENDGNMSLRGAEIEDGYAIGYDSKGNRVRIVILDEE